MHTVSMILLSVGAVVLLGAGLISVLHDLLVRGPHDAPLIKDSGLAWPPRYRGGGTVNETAVTRDASFVKTRDASAGWTTTRRHGSCG